MNEHQQSLLTGAGVLTLSALLVAASGAEWIDARWDLRRTKQRLEESAISPRDTDSALLVPPASELHTSGADPSVVSRMVNRISGRVGVRIVSSRDAPPVSYKLLRELPTEIVAEGEFAALVGMLDQIEASTPNIRVRRAEFRSDPNINSVSLSCVVSLVIRRASTLTTENPVFPGQNHQRSSTPGRDGVLFGDRSVTW